MCKGLNCAFFLINATIHSNEFDVKHDYLQQKLLLTPFHITEYGHVAYQIELIEAQKTPYKVHYFL